MVTRRISVILEGTASGLIRAFQAAGDAADRADDRISRLGKHIDENAQHYQAAGTALAAFGAATTAALGASAAAAISWESDFAGVRKTVDDTAEGYAELSGELRGMARELPASHSAIAGVAEAAGQLGIERENITAFTRTMIDLGESTNLSADQAATALARFANIMGTSQTEFSNLESSIVELGNNYATTEAEIVEMGLRLAGAGRQARLTEGEVLGLATALSSVGIEAQAGGTAFSRVIIEMGTAVDTQSGKLRTFAQVAGMSAEEFSTAWRDNAGSAIAAFVAGLGEMEASGQTIQPILEDLGMTDIRVGDALRRASAAADLFTGAMDTGNQAYAENIALSNEAAQRYETTASQLGVLRNTVIDAGISLGEVFLPAINALADSGQGLAAFLADLPPSLQKIAAWSGAAAGGVSLLAGGMLLLAPRALETYRAFQALGIVGPKTTAAIRNVASFLTGPWGLAIAGAVTALGIFISHQAKVRAEIDEVRGTLDEQTGAVTENTRAWAANLASSEGALDWAADLGLKAGVVTDAMMGNADAIAQVQAAAKRANMDVLEHSDAWGAVDKEYSDAADSGRRLVDFISAKTGVVSDAVEAEAAYRAELEATGRTTAQLAVESQRLTAQAEAYEASQTGAASALEATRRELAVWSPAMERAADLGDEAADSYANWAGEMSGLAASFVDFTAGLGDSYEGINAYLSGLEEMIEAQINWAENMTLVAARVPSDVAEQLARLGPEAAPFIADLTTASEAEIERTIEAFRQGGAQIPEAFAGNMADAGPVLRAAAARWGQDIADGIAVELAAGRTTVEQVVAEYDLATTINVQADPARFDETLNASIALGNESWAEPQIFGDADPFAAELGAALGMANKAEATSTLLGNTEPYVVALMGALREANRSEATSKLKGNPAGFFSSLATAMYEANRSEATASLNLSTGNAFSSLWGFLNSIPSSVSIALRATPMGSAFSRMIPGLATGGPIHGAGTATSDSNLIRASHGEHVLTAREVESVGGHDEVYRLRKAMLSGEVRYDVGGQVGAPRYAREAARPRFTAPAPVYSLPAQGRVSDAPVRLSGPIDLSDASARLVARYVGEQHGRATTEGVYLANRLERARRPRDTEWRPRY